MKNTSFHIAGFFMAFAFISCGSNTQDFTNEDIEIPTQNPPEVPVIEPEEPEGLDKLLLDTRIECGDKGCPESIALVSFINERYDTNTQKTIQGVAQCTGFYIGNSIAITNDHCIPYKMRVDPKQCSDQMQFHFGNGEKVACQEVLHYSKNRSSITGFWPDYAIIKLSHEPKIKALSVSQESIKSNSSPLKILAFDPIGDENNVAGRFREHTCKVTFGGIFAPQYSPDNQLLLVTRDCETQSGNSGSPLLNEKGEVQAIHHHRGIWPAIWQKDAYGNPVLEPRYSTNLACLDLNNPAVSLKQEAHCSTSNIQPLNVLTMFSSQHLKDKIEFQLGSTLQGRKKSDYEEFKNLKPTYLSEHVFWDQSLELIDETQVPIKFALHYEPKCLFSANPERIAQSQEVDMPYLALEISPTVTHDFQIKAIGGLGSTRTLIRAVLGENPLRLNSQGVMLLQASLFPYNRKLYTSSSGIRHLEVCKTTTVGEVPSSGATPHPPQDPVEPRSVEIKN